VKAQMVDGEEQWLKLRGRWHDWGVGLDVTTALAVLAALLPSRRPWAGRGLGWQRRRLKKGRIVKVSRDLEPVKDVKGGGGAVTDKSKSITGGTETTGSTGSH